MKVNAVNRQPLTQRMPLLVLLLFCLLLQSFDALRIFWLEVAVCVPLC